MRRIAVVTLLALPLTAAAQPGVTPYYAQPPGPVPEPVAAEPRTRLEIGLVAASPKGDWQRELGAETSPGFHLGLGFAIAPTISLFVGLRYLRVKLVDDGSLPQNFDLSHRELQIGLRYTTPLSPTAKFFLEGHIQSATLALDYEGQSDSVSGVGLGARGGIMFMVDRRIGIGGAIGYSSADISEGGSEAFEDAWLSADGFVSFGF